MRILLVDDSATTRAIIRSALEQTGHGDSEVLEAADGKEALDLLKNEKLEMDLVLADWNMPRVDGITFLKQVRLIAPFREIPVIMITGQSDRSHVTEALRWGARDYIVKPFSAETLGQKLRALRSSIEAKKNEDTTVMLRMIVDAAQPTELPFLSRLPEDIRQAVRECAEVVRHPQGNILLNKGQEVESFLIVADGEVDLLDQDGTRVLDILEPGECLGERAFMSGTAFPMTARARTPVEISVIARGKLGDLVRRFPKLRFHLTSLLAHRPAAPAGPTERGLSGGLKTVPIGDLIQVLFVTRKTGILILHQEARQAGIYFDRGEVRHAWVDDVKGETALRELLRWTDAAFAFRSGERSQETSLQQATMSLLMKLKSEPSK